MLEIKHVKLLEAISRLGTLSSAARELGYSQPAISQQLRNIERYLRTPLVIRTSQGAFLTEAGQIVVDRGNKAIEALALANSEVLAISGLETGKVRLASFPSGAATVLPPTLGKLHRMHQGLQFSLAEAEPEQALELLRSGKCDVALVYNYNSAPGASMQTPFALDDEVVIPITTENVYVALSPGHPAARKADVDLIELESERWVAGCTACRGHLVSTCQEAGFVPEVAFETDDYVALQGLVAEGLGVALIPELMLRAARTPSVLELRLLKRPQRRLVAAVTTKRLTMVPAIKETLNALASLQLEPQKTHDFTLQA